ncbi:endonuclease/exonuclease/phosphatase family protein [Pseudooceanicola marinus]|uniref:endonuclease/exonuclease/phosphatase family protein n=1 Tax=Pseudooceanicola marinus TaxID=396013 RepID=UPI001CD37962|nr:endonuclease/exonuclease/phosphatase family protein [Pseudooceanicola marinus]MCA1338184.1 endonuclease/exonuclease/phosphatase family protein [Pseudooceanicola marinus]
MSSLRERLRERLVGAFLLLAALCVLLGAFSGQVPDPWFFSALPRFLENVLPWILAAGLGLSGLTVCLGARWTGALMAVLCLLAGGGIAWQHLRLSAPTVAGPADLRVLFFNVESSNDANARAIAERVIAQDPDVVVFAEAHPMRLARDLLKAHYAFAPDCPQGGCAMQVYAHEIPDRYEFRDLSGVYGTRFFHAVFETGLETGGQGFDLYGVHLLKPWLSGIAPSERNRLIRRLTRDAEAGPRPAVMLGDYNAAPWNHALVELMQRTGFRAERRLTGTWPPAAGDWGVPLDHALVRGGMRVVSVQPMGEGLGSNHRGLLVSLRRDGAG